MEMVRMEAALRTLGRCVPRVPERTVRSMTRTVRVLEQERARRAGNAAPAMAPEKTREQTRELQPKKHDPRKL